jgi:hypothetical protein
MPLGTEGRRLVHCIGESRSIRHFSVRVVYIRNHLVHTRKIKREKCVKNACDLHPPKCVKNDISEAVSRKTIRNTKCVKNDAVKNA